MSVAIAGASQWMGRASSPGGTFAMAAWIRRDSVSGLREFFIFRSDGSGFTNWSGIEHLNTTGIARDFHGSQGVGQGLLTEDAWYWIAIWYDGTTYHFRRALDGAGAWAGTDQTLVAAADASVDDIALGAYFSSGGGAVARNISCALWKIWDGGHPTDAELLAERTDDDFIVSTNAWGLYKFESGALTTDSSGNSRTLTNNGTCTYTADDPTDLVRGGGAPEEAEAEDGVVFGDSSTGTLAAEEVEVSDGVVFSEQFTIGLGEDTGPEGIIFGDAVVGNLPEQRTVEDGFELGDSLSYAEQGSGVGGGITDSGEILDITGVN